MAYPVSDAFRTALTGDHRVVVQADICDVDGTVLASLQPISGSVTVDIDRAARREAGDLTLVDPTGALVPTDLDDLLSPLNGYELRLYRGIAYADDTTELVPLGVFGWSGIALSDSGEGLTITLTTLIDRSQRIARARYANRVVVTKDTAVETAIANVLKQAWPAVAFASGDLPETGLTMPAVAYGVEGDSDPWADAQDIAESKGFRVYFNVNGEVELQSATATPDPIATYGEGGDLMVVSIDKGWDTADTYNGVRAVGEGSGLLQIASATVWDDDPTSPTYYLGSFGRRLRVYSSPLLITNADAKQAARLQLSKTAGVAENLTWNQIVDPSLDVGDAVTIVRSSMGVDARYQIDRLTVPLDATQPMSATARTRRVS